jgi:hypothetical protein
MRAWMWLVPLLVCGCDVTLTTGDCSDGLFDGNETDIDCGGSCRACSDGRGCLRDADCQSAFCDTGGRCATPASSGLPDSTGAQVYSIDPGAGLVVQPGVQAGFGITGNTGGSYRIIWTGEAASGGASYNNFTGTIWTTGQFDSFNTGCAGQCPLESDDVVNQPVAVTGGEVITFDATASTGLDGFDFTVTAEPVYFDLQIDGSRLQAAVFFSSGNATVEPSTDPFGLSTQ